MFVKVFPPWNMTYRTTKGGQNGSAAVLDETWESSRPKRLINLLLGFVQFL